MDTDFGYIMSPKPSMMQSGRPSVVQSYYKVAHDKKPFETNR